MAAPATGPRKGSAGIGNSPSAPSSHKPTRHRRARSSAWRMNRTHRVRCRSDGRRSLPADASTDSITAPRAPSRREGPRLDQSPGPQFHGSAMSFTHRSTGPDDGAFGNRQSRSVRGPKMVARSNQKAIDMQLIDPIKQAIHDHLNAARAGDFQRVARVDIIAFAVWSYR